MKEVFFFNSMLTPKIITGVYWLLLAIAFISGLGSMFAGHGGMTFGQFLMGLLIMGGGALGARIWCELLIVLFKIHENLRDLVQRDRA